MKWMLLGSLPLVLAWALPASAKTHIMSGPVDPAAVPAWGSVFDEGPFDLPEGATPGLTADEACQLGWAALHRLDDREAERAFRLAVRRDEDNPFGYLGLALANDAWPGRAQAFASRAAQKRAGALAADQPLIDGFAELCAARGTRRATCEKTWLNQLLETLPDRPEGAQKMRSEALAVRWLARTGRLAEARAMTSNWLATQPTHPVQAYRLWLADDDAAAAPALLDCPATPGALRAAGDLLQRLGRYAEAARWFTAAADLAAARHPADMEDWRLVELMRVAAVEAQASAGDGEFSADAPLANRLDGWLRLAQWHRIESLADLPPRAPLPERAALVHAQALAAFAQGKPQAAWPRLAALQQIAATARRPNTAVAADALTRLDAAEAELQVHNLLARSSAAEAAQRLSGLRGIPPIRLARLALAAGQTGDALRLAHAAETRHPRAVPETTVLANACAAAGQSPPPPPSSPRPFPAPPPPTRASEATGSLPPWILRDAGGAARPLSDVLTKPTVFIFFLGHQCRHCMNQLRTFAPLNARFEKAGAAIVAISADDSEGVAQTFQSLETEKPDLPFPFLILADPQRDAFRPWGVIDEFEGDAIHGVFIVDPSGRLRWRHLGVEPFMMVGDVLAAVEELFPPP